MSAVIFKSILVQKNLFFLGFCLAGVFAFLSFSLLFLTYISFPNLCNALIKANMDFQGLPFWGLDHSWKMPNCEWCSLEVSHSTFIHNTQSQHFRPKKNTSIVMTLTHFCSALASQFEASNSPNGIIVGTR